MTVKDLWGLVKAAGSGWVDDYAQSMGAALAYYTMFSIAPLLLIVISIAGLVFGDQAARGEIFHALPTFLPDGKHFLLSVPVSESSAAQIVVVLNWAGQLANSHAGR